MSENAIVRNPVKTEFKLIKDRSQGRVQGQQKDNDRDAGATLSAHVTREPVRSHLGSYDTHAHVDGHAQYHDDDVNKQHVLHETNREVVVVTAVQDFPSPNILASGITAPAIWRATKFSQMDYCYYSDDSELVLP